MIELSQRIHTHIANILREFGATDVVFVVERPADPIHGDFASNAALVCAKALAKSPREIAEAIGNKLHALNDPDIVSIEVAGAGFLNIRVTDDAILRTLENAVNKGKQWGKNDLLAGKRVMVEYTDPNPFKEFHIGHLLPNTIGESLSRIFEAGGAEVKRVNYQGDVGMHVAMAIWGIMHSHEDMPHEDADPRAKAAFMGKSYAKGAKAYKEDEKAKEAITGINKKIYSGGDPLIDALYRNGKRWSLEYFETIYALLGTNFDHYFFESETASRGEEVVRANIGKCFEQSEGAVIFRGEQYGLHTRVFINKESLPTYEAKELGLAAMKYELFPYDLSYIVTAHEIAEYFQVLLATMSLVYEKEGYANKTRHVAHGMLRLTNGKLSSREGNVITALELIDDAKEEIRTRITDRHELSEGDRDKVAQAAAVGAVKYSILRQESGKDIIFDFRQSLSFDGDSGPYLQYSLARLYSLLRKASELGVVPSAASPESLGELERIIARFPEVVARALNEIAPHHIANYLIALARTFNSYYGAHTIVSNEKESPYRIFIAKAVAQTLENGLSLLAIPTLEKM